MCIKSEAGSGGLRSPKGQLEETSSKWLQAIALLRGFHCPWSDSRGIRVPQWVTALILTFGLLPAAEELLSSGEQGVSTAAQSLFPSLA